MKKLLFKGERTLFWSDGSLTVDVGGLSLGAPGVRWHVKDGKVVNGGATYGPDVQDAYAAYLASLIVGAPDGT